jgi:hypothetical protein
MTLSELASASFPLLAGTGGSSSNCCHRMIHARAAPTSPREAAPALVTQGSLKDGLNRTIDYFGMLSNPSEAKKLVWRSPFEARQH